MNRRIDDLDLEQLQKAEKELEEALRLWAFTNAQGAKLQQALNLIRLTLYRTERRAASAEVAS